MSEIGENGKERGAKRKKKRSSMQMAKKYARRSERGHGSELDSDTYQYMIRILEMLRQDFPSNEDKLNFVNNVYEQTIGREIEFARNQVGSRVLDSLLDYASYEVIKRLADALSESLRPMCSDRFASHVLQKMIRVCVDRGNPRLEATTKESARHDYDEIALKLCRYVINNFEEFVWDTYANHVLRTVIECSGGALETRDEGTKKSTPNYEDRRIVSNEYTSLLSDAANRFLKWPQFVEFGKDEATSGLAQTLLRTLRGVDSKLATALVKRIITECFPAEDSSPVLSTIFHAECSVRLLEVCLAVSKEKTFERIYRRFFVGHCVELSLMSGGNFAVQRLLDHCRSKEILEETFDELSPRLADVLARKNTGVLASLANACQRLQCRQGPFLNSLAKTLRCDETPETQSRIALAVAALRSVRELKSDEGVEEGDELKVHLHGSVILQATLRFNKPIKMVNSLLAIEPRRLVQLFGDPKGSRILDAFFDSKYIGEKSREKLAKVLQGHWVDLARGIHGSRCLERIWSWSKTNQRHWIMEELASVGESLNSTKSGKIIAAKLNVALYARNKKDWSDAQGKQEKTKALFADIIAETKPVERKKNVSSP